MTGTLGENRGLQLDQQCSKCPGIWITERLLYTGVLVAAEGSFVMPSSVM